MLGMVGPARRWKASALLWLLMGVTVAQAVTPLEEGWERFNAGNITAAYDTFTKLFKENPEDPDINFALGRAAFENNHPSHALLAFERVLMQNPEDHRARLELARTYFVMGHYDAAQENFKIVLESDPPEKVKENIDLFLKEIHSQTKRLQLTGSVELRTFYDNNVNYGPANGEVDTSLGTLRVGDGSLPQSEMGYTFDSSYKGAYDFGASRHWLGTAGVYYNQTWLESSAEQESRYAHLYGGARHVGERHMLDLDLRIAHLNHGHTPYLDIYGGDVSWLFIYRNAYHFTSALGVDYRDFELDGRDGVSYSLAQSVTRIFGKYRHNLGATVRGFYNDSKDIGYRNSGSDVAISGVYNLPTHTALHAQLQYRLNDYEGITYPLLQRAPRRDNQYMITAGIQHPLTDYMRLGIFYQYVENQSNFGLYDYTRDVVGCSVGFSF